MKVLTRESSRCLTETVWDGGRSSTGVTGSGDVLTVGNGADRVPEQLLLLGVEGAFMESFLDAAREAELDVLGYVSSGHLDPADDLEPVARITLRPCVVVESADDAKRVERISKTAQQRCIVSRLLGDRLRVRVGVQLETFSS